MFVISFCALIELAPFVTFFSFGFAFAFAPKNAYRHLQLRGVVVSTRLDIVMGPGRWWWWVGFGVGAGAGAWGSSSEQIAATAQRSAGVAGDDIIARAVLCICHQPSSRPTDRPTKRRCLGGFNGNPHKQPNHAGDSLTGRVFTLTF